ncbi:MAG: SDR family oxidoreductase [Alphaproteobacteria bacterium]|nr:SDR family oxidoreductase [Alphaproteobacteria bacterium]
MPRHALITGAAKRIGRAITLKLAARGFNVTLHCHRSRPEAELLAQEIRSLGVRAHVAVADLACESDVERLVPEAHAALGPLGVLINNASVFERDEALSTSRELWDMHMETNLRAPFVLTQSFARHLPEGAKGAVVNLIDQRVWNLTPHFTTYTLSKAGLWTLTRTLALALAPHIRVNAVGPGPALPSIRQSAQEFERQCRAMPLQRGTTPDEIADAVCFLIDAPAVTGQMIALDGGQHLGWSPASPPWLKE